MLVLPFAVKLHVVAASAATMQSEEKLPPEPIQCPLCHFIAISPASYKTHAKYHEGKVVYKQFSSY